MAETSLAHPAHTVPAPEMQRHELHHRVPRCLLKLHDRAASHPDFDGEGIELWLEFEHEAMRYGVDAGISRDDLAVLIEASTVLLPREEHRAGHESDFVRWGRRGGRETFRRYGRPCFALWRDGDEGGSVPRSLRRPSGAVLMAPQYEVRECWRCLEGRVYAAVDPVKRPRLAPCTTCGGAGHVSVYLYPKSQRQRRRS